MAFFCDFMSQSRERLCRRIIECHRTDTLNLIFDVQPCFKHFLGFQITDKQRSSFPLSITDDGDRNLVSFLLQRLQIRKQFFQGSHSSSVGFDNPIPYLYRSFLRCGQRLPLNFKIIHTADIYAFVIDCDRNRIAAQNYGFLLGLNRQKR